MKLVFDTNKYRKRYKLTRWPCLEYLLIIQAIINSYVWVPIRIRIAQPGFCAVFKKKMLLWLEWFNLLDKLFTADEPNGLDSPEEANKYLIIKFLLII